MAKNDRDQIIYKPGLTDGASNNVIEIAVPAGEESSGSFEWTVRARQGTTRQVLFGNGWWEAVQVGGGGAVQVNGGYTVLGPGTTTAGTLALAAAPNGWTFTAGASKITVAVAPNSSLVPTLLVVEMQLHQRTMQEVTRL